MSGLKTAMYDLHKELGGNIVEYAGWELPTQYEGLTQEHEAVRNAAGIFDVSHMGMVYITGPDAMKYANYVLSNDVNKIENGQSQYTMLLNDKGGVVDDLIVNKYNDEKLLLVVNGANRLKDVEWLNSHKEGYDVEIIDDTMKVSMMALQGPKAQEILQKFVDIDLDEIEYYHFKEGIDLDGVEATIPRAGYTGEDGFEIYVDWDKGPEVFKKLVDAGAVPAGLGCRDTLRFEASMPLYGNEIDEDMNPLEAGLGFTVDFNKEGDFIGKEALAKIKADGVPKKIAGIELKGKGIPRQGYRILKDGKDIGVITTGYLAPTVGKPIANVIIDADEAELGNEVEVQIRKRTVPAEIIGRRFLQK